MDYICTKTMHPIHRTGLESSPIDTMDYTFTNDTLTVSGLIYYSIPDEDRIVAFRDTQYYRFEVNGSKLILHNETVSTDHASDQTTYYVGLSGDSPWEVTEVKNNLVSIKYPTSYGEVFAKTTLKKMD